MLDAFYTAYNSPNSPTGGCFDAYGNFYATNFDGNNMTAFTNDGAYLTNTLTWGPTFNSDPESCIVDSRGDVYVGEADGNHLITKLDLNGNQLGSFSPAIDGRGSDWIDLAADQCTMYYTSEGSKVKAFNVCTNQQLGDFATGLAGPCYALRIRPNGEILVACASKVYRLSPTGSVVQTYADPGGGSDLFALNLDPDGTSFWVGDLIAHHIYRLDIASGNVLTSFNVPLDPARGQTGGLQSISVVGEPVSGQPSPPSPVETYGPGSPSENRCPCQAGDPVNTDTGDFWETFDDLAIPGRGIALDLTHTYNSLLASQDSPLGFGWTDSYNTNLTADSSGNVTVHEEAGSSVTFASTYGGYQAPSRVLATLAANPDGTLTFTRIRSQEKLVFAAPGSGGQLLKQVDRDGYTTGLSYTSGKLASVTDPAGRQLTISYNTSGRIASVSDNTNRTVSFGYDTSGNLTDVIDIGGGHTHFTYDTNHLLLTMQDPRQYPTGPVTTNLYDNAGRVIRQTDPLNHMTTFSYTTNSDGSQTTTTTDPNGNVTTQLFQGTEQVQLTRGVGTPQQATWKYAYDPYTVGVTSVTDPNNHVWSQTWDLHGNVLTSFDGLFNETRYTYDSINDVTSVTDANATKTTLQYDGSGDLLSISRPLTQTGQTATTTFVYGDSAHPGDITAITDPNGTGHTTSFSHDPTTGNLLSMSDAAGDKTTYGYDSLGRVTSIVSPNGNVTGGNPSAYTTSIGYNAFGDITAVTDPLQHQTLYASDSDRNLQSVEDGRLNTTTYTHDADNELTGVGYPDGTSIGFSYDGDGNVLSQADGLNHPTSYTYDSLNRVLSMTDPLNRITSYGYDLAGNLTSLKDAMSPSRTTSYGYDAANRLTSISYSDGLTPNVSFGYDNDSQRTSMTDGTGTSSYSYDSLNRLTQSKNGAAQIVTYGYDLTGNLTSLTYPSNSVVTRTYDLANRLTQVKDWSSNATGFAYDADSNPTTQTYPNGTTANLTYNAADQLTQVVDKKSGTPFWTFGYGRDADGQLASASDPLDGLQHTYGYDTLNRLTSDARSSGTTSWAYNAADELTSIADTGANMTTTLGYDLAHELTGLVKKTGSTTNQNLTLSYNANGDRTQQTDSVSGATTTYGYDQADRLTGYTKSGSTSTYKYNGDGLRASKVVSGKTNTFAWDLAEGVPLTLQDSSSSYVTGPGGLPIEQIAGAKAYYFYQDQLGSTRGLLDSKGNTVATYTYGPYGDLRSSTGSITTPFQYASGYTDAESGLQYLRARYYDPATAQFLTVDPIVGTTGEPYSYTAGNPINALDPLGLGCSVGFVPVPCPGDVGHTIGSGVSNVVDWGLNKIATPAYAPNSPENANALARHAQAAGTGSWAPTINAAADWASILVWFTPEGIVSDCPRASELITWAESQGWRLKKTPTGPFRYFDEQGYERVTMKRGSPRTPGSEFPHASFRDERGQRVDPYGNPVTRRDPGNHTPIIWDLP